MGLKLLYRIKAFWTFAPMATVALAAIALVAGLDTAEVSPLGWNPLTGTLSVLFVVVAGWSILQAIGEAKTREEDAAKFEASERAELMRDHTTGALLRRYFFDACEQRFIDLDVGASFAYFALDLDYLKVLNDSYGHEVGDRALLRIVEAIDETFGDEALVGRLGGDEFATLLPCQNSLSAMAKAERLLAEIRKPVLIRGQEMTLSASIGMVLVPEHTALLSETVQFSDLALYKSKKDGRDRAAIFDRTMLNQFREERRIERDLRSALERGDMRLSYLPVVSASGRLVEARTIIGWASEPLTTIGSETVLRVAQNSTLIHRIAGDALAQACRDAVGLDMTFVVDIFPAQLKRDDIASLFHTAITQAGIEPRRIIAALPSEVAGTARQPQVLRRLRELREVGVRIVLDDVSALIVNFEQLREFPVDFVRVPERQIVHLGESEIDNVMVSAMASVGAAMGLGVNAEGIQNPEQLLLARTAGCTHFCGPLFGGPLRVDELRAVAARGTASIRGRTQAAR